MSDLFNLDNPVMRFLFKVCDLLILNLLFILTSLPLFTIGASLSALYAVTLRMVRGEEGYIVKGYFKAFAQNFLQSTILWIGAVLVFLFLWYDSLIIFSQDTMIFQILKLLFSMVLLISMAVFLYIWPILSYFVCSTRQVLKNALFMSLGFLPWTVLILLCLGTLVYLALHISYVMIAFIGASMFFAFSLTAYLTSIIFYRLFQRFQ